MSAKSSGPTRLAANSSGRARHRQARAAGALWSGAVLLACVIPGQGGVPPELDESKLPPPARVQVDYARDIKPLLEGHCYKCHAGDKPKSNFRLSSRETALKGGSQGIDIVPGQSAKSHLVYYVARVVPDMEMPPEGRGLPLTTNEVALLRAWIDQGAKWEPGEQEPQTSVTFAPFGGGTAVSGDRQKFREVTRQPTGWNGGAEEVLVEQRPDPDTRLSVAGQARRDDYRFTLSAERNNVGFARAGWSQFRTYYDDQGGYDPRFSTAPFELSRGPFLDSGRAWADLGLTFPGGPTIVLGYEYQYRKGQKSTLQWGAVSNAAGLLNVFPAAKDISENVQVVKFKAEYEVAGVLLNDTFRGEWYRLQTERQNDMTYGADSGTIALTKADERQRYFNGANVFHAEKQLTDWLFAGGGYLYSRLTSDASVDVQTLNAAALDPSLVSPGWHAPRIDLERDSHVFSVSAMISPWKDLSLSLGTQNEWTRQQGLGGATADLALPFAPFLFTADPEQIASSLDRAVFSQTAGLRFTAIPCSTLFAEARSQQENIGQYEEEVGGLSPFLLKTDETTRLRDFRLGFNTSPWRRAEFSGEYKRYDKKNDFDNSRQEVLGLPFQAYPGFIRSREILSDEAQGRVTLSPSSLVRLALMYQWINTKYHTATEAANDPLSGLPGGIATGQNILAGTYQAHNPSLNLTFTPVPRLFLSATLAYQNARTVTADNASPSVAPYHGNVYSLIGSASYLLDKKTDLFAGYSYSMADFSQDVPPDGLALGIKYRQHSAQFGIKRQVASHTTVALQYRFYHYDEPTSGSFNNFNAHAVFGTLTWKMP